MTQRTDSERDEYLARWVMGWHICKLGALDYWAEGDKVFVYDVADWHPSTDLNQAMQVAEAMRQQKGWEMALVLYPEGVVHAPQYYQCTADRRKFGERALFITETADTLPQAITLAAEQAAKVLEQEAGND